VILSTKKTSQSNSIYFFLLSLILLSIVSLLLGSVIKFSTVQAQQPVTYDSNLKVVRVLSGLKFPSNMAFLGPNDILVLEKDEGTVKRIVNGTMLPQPLLHVNVATVQEEGMLGIAVAKHQSGSIPTYVFLYYTQSTAAPAASNASNPTTNITKPLCNCLYRYEFENNKLVNPKLLLSLPANPGPDHNAGKLLIGPDNNLYLTIGTVGTPGHQTQAQNIKGGPAPDGTSGILRITQDGKPVGNNGSSILGSTYPLNLYYAYGIRNSFGIDFDPLTKNLWDTENGPNFGDEINLVEPGFNSGWVQVQGIWKTNGDDQGPIAIHPERDLVDFGGKGKYRAPEFTWQQTVGPTAIKFLDTTKLGKQYQNDIFVSDVNNANIYHFKLAQNRTHLLLNGSLANKVLMKGGKNGDILFATGFGGGITDMKVGPDGYLYVVSLTGSDFEKQENRQFSGGAIYRIEPVSGP
jgi:glucose/arabinose dehydrogenase